MTTIARITGGVDTHLDTHVVAALDTIGGLLGVESFPADAAGYRAALDWLQSFGEIDRVGLEGTGSYGADLSRFLLAHDVEVIEIDRPNRQLRRRDGQSDPKDAVAAARATLSREAKGRARHDRRVTAGLAGVEWPDVVLTLAERGWARLAGVVAPELCQVLTGAASEWSEPQYEEEFGVRSGRGGASHSSVDDAPLAVREFAAAVVAAVNGAALDLPAVPGFNHLQWARDDHGVLFITPHRDPPSASGILAVLTASGAGTFRVWDADGEHEWLTGDGDLVLLRGAGWPTPHSECPVHQTESPLQGGRTAITFRHNIGGFGADYFAALRARQPSFRPGTPTRLRGATVSGIPADELDACRARTVRA